MGKAYINKSCVICGVVFNSYLSQERKYCSRGCMGAANVRNQTRSCIICKKDFTVKPSSDVKLCSRQCNNKHRSETQSGERHVMYRHGMNMKGKVHPIYRAWSHLKERCDNKNIRNYNIYGGRGITYSESWGSFDNFLKDMQDSWVPGLTIDRIDVNSNYCKENCRWVTPAVNARNKRNNRLIEYNEDKITVAELSEITKIPYKQLWAKLKINNWDIKLINIWITDKRL